MRTLKGLCRSPVLIVRLVIFVSIVGVVRGPFGAQAQTRTHAAQDPDAPPGAVPVAATRPLAQWLQSDGTLDLEPGFWGSVDATGYRLVSGPQEEPRFAPLTTGDANWSDRFGFWGTDGKVRALAVDGRGNLYVGGDFTTVGGLVAANRIAKWDGRQWSPLGGGMDAEVLALVIDRTGHLYAGGTFTTAGGLPANRIAMWDGSSWSHLGTGMNDRVVTQAVDGDTLYAGGWFTQAGGATVNHIARWNGSSWSALGGGTNAWVAELAVDGSGNLVAGGLFTTAGGVTANYIARWDGANWSGLGGGMNSWVLALAVEGEHLYAGGSFTQAGGTPASYIAEWDSNAWTALGSGTDDWVGTIAVDEAGNGGPAFVAAVWPLFRMAILTGSPS
jgi:hypothetical protein